MSGCLFPPCFRTSLSWARIFLDLVSASGGKMSKRYGLVYVDRDDEGRGTNRRICKDSFFWYRDYLKSLKEG